MWVATVFRWWSCWVGVAFSILACSRVSRPTPSEAGEARPPEVQGNVERGASGAEGDATNAMDVGASVLDPTPKVDAEPAPYLVLEAESPLVSLEVPGHGSAIAWLPLGVTSPRPLIVATHGNYDTPESTCNVWGSIVASRGFVLCPRGVARPDSPSRADLVYHYLSAPALEKEISAALESLELVYGSHLDSRRVIYSGFSQGAIMGVSILLREAERYSRVVMIEGGFDQWNRYSAQAYAKGGGERVLFACGQWNCDTGGKKAAKRLGAVGVKSRVVSALGSGHTYGGDVADELRAAFDWLVEGDPRWGIEGLPIPSKE